MSCKTFVNRSLVLGLLDSFSVREDTMWIQLPFSINPHTLFNLIKMPLKADAMYSVCVCVCVCVCARTREYVCVCVHTI